MKLWLPVPAFHFFEHMRGLRFVFHVTNTDADVRTVVQPHLVLFLIRTVLFPSVPFCSAPCSVQSVLPCRPTEQCQFVTFLPGIASV